MDIEQATQPDAETDSGVGIVQRSPKSEALAGKPERPSVVPVVPTALPSDR